jgi:hypothetical protein
MENQTDSPSQSTRFRKNSIRILLVTIGVASFLLVGLVAWRGTHNRAQQQELRAALDLLSTQGSPVNADGVKKLHQSSTNTELTDEWNSLFDELTSVEFLEATESFPYLGNSHLKDDSIPPRGQPWEAEAGAIKFLTETKSLRDRLRKLAIKSRSVYLPMNYEGEGQGDSSSYSGYKQALKLLRFESYVALRLKASAAVLEDIRCFTGLSNLLDGTPSINSFLLASAASQNSLGVVQEAVELSIFNEEQLQQLLEHFSVPVSPRHFQLALKGERGMLLSALESLASNQSFTLFGGSAKSRIRMLKLLDRLESAKFEDGDAFVRLIEESMHEIEQFGFTENSVDAMALSGATPVVAAGTVYVRNEMKRKLALIAIGVQLYRHKHGNLPSSLEELAKVNLDPASLAPIGGKPFGYRLNAQKDTATVWGFYIPSRIKQTPTEPLEPVGENGDWVWRFR